jgi:hypothetical protein
VAAVPIVSQTKKRKKKKEKKNLNERGLYSFATEVDRFTLVCCLVYSSTLKMETIRSSGIIFKELQGFITTAVRTSNPIKFYVYNRIRGSIVC